MLESIRDFFNQRMDLPSSGNGKGAHEEPAAPDAEETRRLHVAACALLLELAHADDEFSEAESVVRLHELSCEEVEVVDVGAVEGEHCCS